MSITLNTKIYNFDGHSTSGFSMYTERSAGVSTGFSPLTSKVENGNITSGAKTKIRWKLKLPVIATASDACACEGQPLRESIVDLVVTLDPKATAAERADILARLQDLVLTTEFTASVSSLVQPSA